MASSLEEQASLECFKSQNYISMLMLKSFSEYHQSRDDDGGETRKLEEFLSCLDEERVKIDAFKRELPLSTQLLNSAVETSKQLLQTFKENQQKEKPILEEFIPIATTRRLGSEETEKVGPNISDNKANWMTSAQLWCQSTNNKEVSKTCTQEQRNGGAFSPFIKDRTSRVVCDLGLMVSNEKDMGDDQKCFDNGGVVNEHVKTETNTIAETRVTTMITTSGDHNNSNNNNNNNQTKRKERRCWSPELHRRFVNALQMLGGSQVATPKQIRELMKVDGLTNDEVKSHLQKYRLHTRRPNCLIQQTHHQQHQHQQQQQQQPQLVVLGGIWVPQEYANSYNAPPAPSHYFLPPTAHHHLFNNSTTTAAACMEFEGKGNVERRSESLEDGDEGSNESEITLKI